MNEELFRQLQEAVLNKLQLDYSKDGLTVKVDSKDNCTTVKIEYKENDLIQKERDKFIEYLQSLDDDLFIEICEDLDVNKIQNCLYSDDIEAVRSAIFKFQSHADEVISAKIEYLKSCFSKSHK